MDILYRVGTFLIGYAFGCLQTSYIIGKLFYKIDIRQHGSGNAGATNATRVMGKKFGLITLLFDLLKGLLVVLLCSIIFRNNETINLDTIKIYAAIGAVIGHCYPFFLGFKGGKGVATTGGSIFAFHPWIAISGGALFFLVAFITKYVSLSSITLASFYGIVIAIVYRGNIEIGIIGVLIGLLVIVRHSSNIKRLLNRTELKFSFNHKKEL